MKNGIKICSSKWQTLWRSCCLSHPGFPRRVCYAVLSASVPKPTHHQSSSKEWKTTAKIVPITLSLLLHFQDCSLDWVGHVDIVQPACLAGRCSISSFQWHNQVCSPHPGRQKFAYQVIHGMPDNVHVFIRIWSSKAGQRKDSFQELCTARTLRCILSKFKLHTIHYLVSKARPYRLNLLYGSHQYFSSIRGRRQLLQQICNGSN